MFRIRGLYKTFFTCITLAFSLNLHAQEYILPLTGNRDLEKEQPPSAKKSASDVILDLPVIDDFSYNTPYPSIDIWADDYAYINNGYAVNPPTIGVATMDALDNNGAVYPFATISPESFDADYLTSYPVNLNYPASDSIYLSFFYQPQGNGIEPFPGDSLCLDFYNPSDSTWNKVWGVPGDTMRPFEQVMIPITDPVYLKDGFRFGFRNKASLPQNSDYRDKRGNVDHWNIDYVRLNNDRTFNDTVIPDVAFSEPLASMLRDYESIPWDHFEVGFNTYYRAYIRMTYKNNDTAVRNVTRSAEIYNEIWDETYDPGNSSAQDILPGTTVTHDITSIYPFDFSRGDKASYLMKAWLRTDANDNKSNDTVVRRQVFTDYFAYDDGTAERAYGLRGQGTSNGLIAVRFNSFIPDVLGGIDVYFSQLKDSLNLDYYFRFIVWDDNEGLPGDIIYEDDIDHTVEYSDMLNNFRRYEFREEVMVNGTFYVGLLQYNQYLLNIGLDVNKPADANLFYNIGNGWNISSAPGSLMFRPFVKREFTGLPKTSSSQPEVKIWPNPARDFIHIELPADRSYIDLRVTIHDLTGKRIMETNLNNSEIFTGDLPDGIYVVKISSERQLYTTEKIIIRR